MSNYYNYCYNHSFSFSIQFFTLLSVIGFNILVTCIAFDLLTTWMAFYLLPKPSSSKGDNIAALLFPHRLSQNPLATKPIYSIDTFKNLIMHSNRYQSSLYRLLVLSLLLYTSTVYINTPSIYLQ